MSELEGYTHLQDVPYSDISRLNTLEIWAPKQKQEGNDLWVIYIHGGAWRDPLITSKSLLPTLSHLLLLPLSGIASLSYRLSPYPSHPTSPSLPTDPSRTARHPDHLDDILSALKYLHSHHNIKHYILVGHSCGATLAFQAAASATLQVKPEVVVGVEGIYDIPYLVERNSHPAYEEFVTGAFGTDKRVWRDASATSARLGDGVKGVLLAHSRADELVGWDQVEVMEEALGRWGSKAGDEVGGGKDGKERKEVRVLEVKGLHDEVWEDGRELARVIEAAVQWTLSKEI